MVVERELKAKEKKTRHDLGREAFVERVWQWRRSTGDRIFEQLKKLGCSLDWERAELHDGRAVLGGGHRGVRAPARRGAHLPGPRLINWCPDGRTALSDLEVDYDEGTQGELYEFAYPLADGSGEVVVATTRPETMLGDTAVAVHPDDPRHQAKIGKRVRHPFVDRDVPDHRRPDPGRSQVRHRRREGDARPRSNDFEVGAAPRPADDLDLRRQGRRSTPRADRSPASIASPRARRSRRA